MMKNELHLTMFNTKGNELTRITLLNWHLNLRSMEEWCSVVHVMESLKYYLFRVKTQWNSKCTFIRPAAETCPETFRQKGFVLLKRKNIHRDNVRLQTARITLEKNLDHAWSVLTHLPYSPDTKLINCYL